ncbi:hypothetical protein UUU_24920 (plasmid) [Klebsiella pneumoniae subsp. pneumoniae DSM 30104 = JCM 1662 = NBRC 14940]|nr:hypothetical protein UUU_24920 [Klebsiella pneumoniae subsp. pneumoniae DSM 30104 = JCM 1662 = NBRC 14940]
MAHGIPHQSPTFQHEKNRQQGAGNRDQQRDYKGIIDEVKAERFNEHIQHLRGPFD